MEQETKLLRDREVAALLNIGTSSVWFKTKHEEGFPRPIKLGPRTTRWRADDLAAWLDKKSLEVA